MQLAIRKGFVSYVTSDRVREGLFCDLNIADNLRIRVMKNWAPTLFLFVTNSRCRAAFSLAKMIGLSIYVINQSPLTLSGGNQQRVILARSLSTHPKLVFFDNATRGLDSIGKKTLVEQMKSYCSKKGSCIVVAPELDFLNSACDRVVKLSADYVEHAKLVLC
uniref:ABC transporter n=1 Tax=Candidatus Kentrum sp. LPFa TaxID=2126335 RepID=A0A450VSX7_9GAMM|nr:MAG: ABC transporter [Candidatus Kentron sp. LPFa]